MSTTISIICYKSKTLSNGEHPLMIRICKDSKTKYQSLGISVKPEHWDFQKNKPNAFIAVSLFGSNSKILFQ